MILSGLEILRQIESGNIEITPFDKKMVNPNSVNLKLNDKLLIYSDKRLDMKLDNPTSTLTIPKEGLILSPGTLYLGRTLEYTRTENYVPMLEGRSSIGRLGLYVHVTAGFGDVGFKGFWTLEMHCIHPIKIYPYVQICQIYYHSIEGDFVPYTGGKYQGATDVESSKMYKEFI